MLRNMKLYPFLYLKTRGHQNRKLCDIIYIMKGCSLQFPAVENKRKVLRMNDENVQFLFLLFGMPIILLSVAVGTVFVIRIKNKTFSKTFLTYKGERGLLETSETPVCIVYTRLGHSRHSDANAGSSHYVGDTGSSHHGSDIGSFHCGADGSHCL